jgi:chemotaxis protein CheD
MTEFAAGLAEIKISNSIDDVLVAYGLGSCVGVLVHDKKNNIGGLAHVLLPQSDIETNVLNPAKFADTAVPLLINELKKLGANSSYFTINIAGGAQMFKLSNKSNSLNIGTKNIIAVKSALEKLGLKAEIESTGGNKGKTVKLYMESGRMTYKIAGELEKDFN